MTRRICTAQSTSLFLVSLWLLLFNFPLNTCAETYEQTYYDDGADHFMDVYLSVKGSNSFFVNGVPSGKFNYVAYKNSGSGYGEIWSNSTITGYDPKFSTYVEAGYKVKLVIYDGNWNVKSVYYWYIYPVVAADITSVTVTPSSVVVGKKISINYSVKNTGYSPRIFKIACEIRQNSNVVADVGCNQTSTVSVGSSASGSFSYTVPNSWSGGTYTARCVAYGGSSCGDEWLDNYDGNFSVEGLRTAAEVSSVSVSPNPALAGNAITISYTLKNKGNYVKSFRVGCEIRQDSAVVADLGCDEISPISVGSSASGTFTYPIPSNWSGGSYIIRCIAYGGSTCGDEWLDNYDKAFTIEEQNVQQPKITSGRIAWHSYTEYDDETYRDGYHPIDGTIHIVDFPSRSHYVLAEKTIASEVQHAMNPSFSSDGRYLTFMGLPRTRKYSHSDDSWAEFLDVFIYDFRKNLVINLSKKIGRSNYGQLDEDPVFSPDGEWIAFKHQRNNIYAVRLSDYSLRQVTAGVGQESGPQYSPDGEWIYFWHGDGAKAFIAKVLARGERQTHYTTVVNNDSVDFEGDTGIQDYFPSCWGSSRIVYTTWDKAKKYGDKDDDDVRILDFSKKTNEFAAFNSPFPVDDSDAFGIDATLLGFSKRNGTHWDLWYGDPVGGAAESLGIGVPDKHNLGGEYTEKIVNYSTCTPWLPLLLE